MKLYFDDADFDGQLQRTALAAYAQSADLGEMLVTAAKVTPGDNDSWFTAWSTCSGGPGSPARELQRGAS